MPSHSPDPADEVLRHASVCAWCRAELRPGDPALPVSHGICLACAAAMTEQLADAVAMGSR
jgi:hypothetical protein